jgi:hypothetical protein
MQQDMFSQNYMNPMLQQQGMMGQLASGLLSQGLSGMGDMMSMRNQQVQQAGAGKGAAMGGMTDPSRAQHMGGKNAGQAPYYPSSQNG